MLLFLIIITVVILAGCRRDMKAVCVAVATPLLRILESFSFVLIPLACYMLSEMW